MAIVFSSAWLSDHSLLKREIFLSLRSMHLCLLRLSGGMTTLCSRTVHEVGEMAYGERVLSMILCVQISTKSSWRST